MDYPFTPIPNWFFPLVKQLNFSENKIMLCVWYNTVGFSGEAEGSRRSISTLSYTFIQDFTGIKSRTSIYRALKNLESLKLIARSPKRLSGQTIQVSPTTPILPIEVVISEDSLVISDDQGVTSEDSVSHIYSTPESSEMTHNKKPNKNQIQESTTTRKLTPDQEESLQMLVVVGLNQNISRRLILKVWDRGQGKQYITDLLGYAALNSHKNLAGFVRKMLEQNAVIPTSKGIQAPSDPVKLDKWAHGGVNHRFVAHQCEICHPELITQRLEREAIWAAEDQEAQNG